MSMWNRRELCGLPYLLVYSGDKFLCELPWTLFVALSDHLHLANEEFLTLDLPAGLDMAPFVHISNWMMHIGDNSRCPSLQRRGVISHDLGLCRAARFLGLQHEVQKIHNYWWSYFKRTPCPSYEDIDAVMELQIPGHNDPFFDAIALRLGHLVYRDAIPDPEIFISYLDYHSSLETAIDTIVWNLQQSKNDPRDQQRGAVGDN